MKGKRIALCITGSVAAIQSPILARELVRRGADVTVYMSRDAMGIIHADVMEFATGRGVVTALTGKLEHLFEFDLVLIAPATANTIGKIVCGIADTPVTTLVLSSGGRVLLAPAMDGRMYDNSIVRQNVEKLESGGYGFVGPRFGEGKAKMADICDIVDAVFFELSKKDYVGKTVVVTAGPTLEYIDPIRVITNKSSGKMGVAIARAAYLRGAKVKLIYGRGTARVPQYLDTVRVETSNEMLKAVEDVIFGCDIFISAAAVSDFTADASEKKIETEKGDLTLKLMPTPKILGHVKSAEALKVGFKAMHGVSEEELCGAALKSLEKYGLDMVVANDVGTGVFGSDENDVYIAGKEGKFLHMKATKEEIAGRILDLMRRGE